MADSVTHEEFFKKQNKHNVYNFEKIFLELGVEILHNISDYLSIVPSEATYNIRKRIAAQGDGPRIEVELYNLEELE